MTASWLVQMGWPEIAVLENGLAGHALATGPHRPAVPELDGLAVARIAPEELHAQLKAGEAVVIDTASSLIYREDRSDEQTSEPQSLKRNTYACFCMKKKK